MNKNLWTRLGAGVATLIVLILGAVLFVQQRASRPADPDEEASEEALPPVLWDAPAFTFQDQQGRPVSDASLRGSVWIANFFFTQCTSICPGMTAKMVLLQSSLSGVDLGFVSFSVDPTHDTPDVLARYAQEWNPGETRWRLLSTTPDGLARTAAGMKVSVQATDDVKDPILHSNRFLLVDAEGRVRGAYDSSDDGSLERLVVDARRLVGGERGAAASGDALAGLDGKSLFSALGCAACHGDVRLAPPLGGLLGAKVQLEGGTSVIADAAYLEQSIVDPWALLVAGYGPTMPNYRAHLDNDRVRALVEFIGGGELPGKSGARAQSLTTEQAVDPVCKMKVTVTAETPSAVVDGHTTWFCCEYCRDRFLTDPKFHSPGDAGEAQADQSATSPAQPCIDPVCKMEVEVTADTPSSTFEGRTYWFCCDYCRESFAADPKAFGPGAPSLFERPAQPTPEPVGGEWAKLSPTEHIPVAFVLDAGAEVVDFSGPWGVFLYAHVEGRQDSPFQMYVVAETTEPIRLSGGLRVVPDHSFESAPQPRIIVVPALGSEPSEALLQWLKRTSPAADLTMSVCNGAFALGRAGLLTGKTVTLHHSAYGMFAASFPDVSVRRGARYVDSGKVATAGGLSSGIDLALHAVDRFFGRKAALRTALDLEYQGTGWTDPDSNTVYLERPVSTAEHPLCPVCEMEVLPTAPLRCQHEGRTYLFCAEGCKTMFERMPEKFVFQ